MTLVFVNPGGLSDVRRVSIDVARRRTDTVYVAPLAGAQKAWPAAAQRRIAPRVMPSDIGVIEVGKVMELFYEACRRAPIAWAEEHVRLIRNRHFTRAVAKTLKAVEGTVFATVDTAGLLFPLLHVSVKKVLLATAAHPAGTSEAYESVLHRYPEWREGRRAPAFRLAQETASAADASDVIVVNSLHSLRTFAGAGTAARKCRKLPLGIELYGLSVKSAPRNSSEPLRLLYVGQITAYKGIPLLLEAARNFGPAVELHLAGALDPRHKGLLPETVRWHGHLKRDALNELYNAADVLVQPSLSEGFGMTILEGMAHGLPVLATSASAAPDLGVAECGIIVAPSSVEELEQGIAELLRMGSNRRFELGQVAKMTSEEYPWSRYAEGLLALP